MDNHVGRIDLPVVRLMVWLTFKNIYISVLMYFGSHCRLCSRYASSFAWKNLYVSEFVVLFLVFSWICVEEEMLTCVSGALQWTSDMTCFFCQIAIFFFFCDFKMPKQCGFFFLQWFCCICTAVHMYAIFIFNSLVFEHISLWKSWLEISLASYRVVYPRNYLHRGSFSVTVMLYVSQFSGVVKSLLTWEVSCMYMYVHVNK